jgi:hypothetical protein
LIDSPGWLLHLQRDGNGIAELGTAGRDRSLEHLGMGGIKYRDRANGSSDRRTD